MVPYVSYCQHVSLMLLFVPEPNQTVTMVAKAKRILTTTVVSFRSSTWCLSTMTDPPVKVIISVLRKLAGLFPLPIPHVEVTSARQANDVI